MDETARKVLLEVIESKGTTTIIYDGGSAPGTARAIAPISIKDDILVARCLASESRKTFHLSKLRIAGTASTTPRPKLAKEDTSRMLLLAAMDLPELCNASTEIASQYGWTLSLAENTLIAARKKKTVSLAFVPMIQGQWCDGDGLPIEVNSTRPWHVDGRLFSHKCRAFAAFQDELRN